MGQVVDGLRQRIWGLIEPTIGGYSNTIELLLAGMTEDQLRDVIESLGGDLGQRYRVVASSGKVIASDLTFSQAGIKRRLAAVKAGVAAETITIEPDDNRLSPGDTCPKCRSGMMRVGVQRLVCSDCGWEIRL